MTVSTMATELCHSLDILSLSLEVTDGEAHLDELTFVYNEILIVLCVIISHHSDDNLGVCSCQIERIACIKNFIFDGLSKTRRVHIVD